MSKRPNPESIDDENPGWAEADFKAAVSFSELPESLRTKLRGPQKTPTKERITIRLSREVVERFRASGDGWQTRVDAALKDWLKTHSPA
ncbi:MAG: BrnA antitoxin family protein [Betaproteobacteria bacterium]|nr:BrnA antitoxin family protein [Betaproteobacteria bacterium]